MHFLHACDFRLYSSFRSPLYLAHYYHLYTSLRRPRPPQHGRDADHTGATWCSHLRPCWANDQDRQHVRDPSRWYVRRRSVPRGCRTCTDELPDTWAFALPKPEEKKGGAPDEKQEDEAKGKKEGKADEKKGEQKAEEKSEQKTEEKAAPKATPKKKKDGDFPSQEEAEKATSNPVQEGEGKAKDGKDSKDAKDATPQKSTWSSYVPSLPTLRSSKPASAPKKGAETEQQKNSRTWGSYFPSGQGFTSYIPSTASNTVSQFAKGVGLVGVTHTDTG